MWKVRTLAREADSLLDKQKSLFDESMQFERAKSKKANAFPKTIGYYFAEKLVKALPVSSGTGFLSGIYNLYRDTFIQRLGIEKHRNGRVVGDMHKIPVIGKCFQNLWSIANLGYHGISDIGNIYTVLKGGQEYVVGLQKQGSNIITTGGYGVCDIATLPAKIHSMAGNEKDVQNALLANLRPYDNAESTRAGGYAELCDGDIKGIEEYENFGKTYMNGEFLFIKEKGYKSLVGWTPSGEPIMKTERPSKWKMLKFYGNMDFKYTIYDSVMGVAEKALPALGGLRESEKEVANVVGSTLRGYGIAA